MKIDTIEASSPEELLAKINGLFETDTAPSQDKKAINEAIIAFTNEFLMERDGEAGEERAKRIACVLSALTAATAMAMNIACGGPRLMKLLRLIEMQSASLKEECLSMHERLILTLYNKSDESAQPQPGPQPTMMRM